MSRTYYIDGFGNDPLKAFEILEDSDKLRYWHEYFVMFENGSYTTTEIGPPYSGLELSEVDYFLSTKNSSDQQFVFGKKHIRYFTTLPKVNSATFKLWDALRGQFGPEPIYLSYR